MPATLGLRRGHVKGYTSLDAGSKAADKKGPAILSEMTGPEARVAATTKKKPNTPSPKRKGKRAANAAKKGWETRRKNAEAAAKKKRAAPPRKARAPNAAQKGWETRRKNAEASAKKKRAANRKRAATLARKASEKARRGEASKRGHERRRARERAQIALETFVSAVDRKVAARELAIVKEIWRQEKLVAEKAYNAEYTAYLQFLDDLADDVGTEWDIAYGSTDAA